MKSFIVGGMVVASVAVMGNAAMAVDAHAATHPRTARVSHAKAPAHVAARARGPRARASVGARQIPYMFGGWPFFFPHMPPFNGKAVAVRGVAAAPAYVPIEDSPPAIDNSSAARDAQAAVDATSAAIQSMNETSAMVASMAAAEEQNEEANAATLQTELNANF